MPGAEAALDLTVILINWRMREDLQQCLDCIAAHRHRCSAEVIVVNKASGDGTEELIAEKHPQARLFDHPKFGFATMRNVGLREARGRLCLILDTDTELHEGCFDKLVRFMDQHPSLAGCGGRTIRLNGDLEHNVKRFYDLMTVIVRRSPLEKIWPHNPWTYYHQMMDKDHSRPFEGDWMAGACFCIRKEAVRAVGYFDEGMHYFEDVDWCWRAKNAGWRIAYCPQASITHKVQSLSKKKPFSKQALVHLWSGVRFWWKTTHRGMDWAWPERPEIGGVSSNNEAIEGDRPDLSVIIVNWKQCGLLHDCLLSLREAAPGKELEVIVVDNASADHSAEMVREKHPEAALIVNDANLGFTKANNIGIKQARGRHIVMLNNDTKVLPGAFAKAIDYLDAHQEIGAAGLKLLNADRSLQLSCRRFPSFSQALFNRYSLLTRLWPGNPFSRAYLMTDIERDKVQDVDWVSGACLFIRRSVVETIGLLDERFFMYSEDVDYCYRVWKAGWRVSYLPFAEVFHYIGQSSKRARRMTILERHRSMYRFYKKHYSRNLMLLDFVTAGTIWLRCGVQLTQAEAGRLADQLSGRTRST